MIRTLTIALSPALSLGVLALFTLPLWSASKAHAQDSLSGAWQLASSSAQRAHRVSSIEAATEDVPFLVRSTARSRLTERTAPARALRIAVSGDSVRLTRNGRTIALVVGGPARDVGGAQVRATRRDGNLVLHTLKDDTRMTATYQLASDGQRLVIGFHLANSRLSAPVRYRVTYRRRGEGG